MGIHFWLVYLCPSTLESQKETKTSYLIWYIDFTLFIPMDGLILVGSDPALARTQKNVDLISHWKKILGFHSRLFV